MLGASHQLPGHLFGKSSRSPGCVEVTAVTWPASNDSPLLIQEVPATASPAWRLLAGHDAKLPQKRQLIITLRRSIVWILSPEKKQLFRVCLFVFLWSPFEETQTLALQGTTQQLKRAKKTVFISNRRKGGGGPQEVWTQAEDTSLGGHRP